jgi:Domain of unknown function (DUF4266)
MKYVVRESRAMLLARPARAASASLLALCLLGMSACTTVAPYERERLSKPDMLIGRNGAAKAGEEHATAYREGATGATGSSGGGCGCN